MPTSLPSGFSDLKAAGFYLPGIILLAVWHRMEAAEVPVWGILSLMAAVAVHGRVRAVFGPGGPSENPLRSGISKQRMLVALTGKGPADLFADNLIDIALNGHVYWELLSRRRLALAITHLLLSICWLISLPMTLWRVWNAVDLLPTTVLLLTVVLFVWFLQQFVFWRFMSYAHYLEQDPSRNYAMLAKGVSASSRERKPSRPCTWMELTDILILRALSRKAYPVSGFCMAFHTALERVTKNGDDETHEPERAIAYVSFWGEIEETTQQLNALAERGFVHRYNNGTYTISDVGNAYLSGEAPPSMFE